MSNIIIAAAPQRNWHKRGRPPKPALFPLNIPATSATTARVDTLTFSTCLPSPEHSATTARRLKAALGCTVAVKPDNDIGRSKTIVVQDITPARLRTLAASIRAETTLERLDVSVDWKPSNLPDLDTLTATLARALVPTPDLLTGKGRPRQAWGKGSPCTRHLWHPSDLPAPIQPGDGPDAGTVYFGSSGHPVAWKIYAKRLNEGEALPAHQHRARVEVSLAGNTLADHGLVSVPDLLGFDFGKLAALFKFAAATTPAPSRLGSLAPCIDAWRTRALLARTRAGVWSLASHQRRPVEKLQTDARRALVRLSKLFAVTDTQAIYPDTLTDEELSRTAVSRGARYNCEPNRGDRLDAVEPEGAKDHQEGRHQTGQPDHQPLASLTGTDHHGPQDRHPSQHDQGPVAAAPRPDNHQPRQPDHPANTLGAVRPTIPGT